jgi:hypothetical protein
MKNGKRGRYWRKFPDTKLNMGLVQLVGGILDMHNFLEEIATDGIAVDSKYFGLQDLSSTHN